MRFLTFLLFCIAYYTVLILPFDSNSIAQDKPSQTKSIVKVDENDPIYQELKSTHTRLVSKLRESVKAAFIADLDFRLGEKQEADEHRKEYLKAVADGQKAKDQLYDTTLRLLDYTVDSELAGLAVAIHENEYSAGRYGKALVLGRKLLESVPQNELLEQGFDWPRVRQAYMEYTRDNYDFALEQFQYTVTADRVDLKPHPHLLVVKNTLGTTINEWKKEVEIRKKEAADDDLPRVEIKTTKGDIIVELYENQAPETVANFIHLVEQGFYDGSKFDFVIRHQYAYTGKSADGKPTAGWAIKDESQREDARHFFGYTLAMKKSYRGQLPTTEFFFTLKADPYLDTHPNPQLDHTAFGRVIEGKDVVDQIKVTHELPQEDETESVDLEVESPDKIISARVIRKRDHDYLPEKLSIENPK